MSTWGLRKHLGALTLNPRLIWEYSCIEINGCGTHTWGPLEALWAPLEPFVNIDVEYPNAHFGGNLNEINGFGVIGNFVST